MYLYNGKEPIERQIFFNNIYFFVCLVGSLYDALRDLVRWEPFALKLPRIRKPDVQRIKIENKEDVEGQKMALFDQWLRMDSRASWTAVVEALEMVNEPTLAGKIRDQLGLRRMSINNDSFPTVMREGVPAKILVIFSV